MSKLPEGYYKKENTSKMTESYTPKETLEEVKKLPCMAITERGISKETAQHFGIKSAVDEKTGKVIAHYFPYTFNGEVTGYKKRDLTVPKFDKKHFQVVGTQSYRCDMFGTDVGNKTGGKKLFITEGEYDAAILWQVLKQKHTNSNPTVVSISNGTASAVLNIGQKNNQTYIKKFSEVVLVFDNDKSTPAEREQKIMKGQDAVAAVYGLMPDVWVADLVDNADPCDMFKDGLAEQLYWACMKPKQFTPDGFVKYAQIEQKAKELPVLGKPWPWPSLTKLTLGRRLGEGYFIGAGVKIGKSEFVNKFCEHVKITEGKKVALFKFEEEPEITCKKVAGKIYKKDFTNPEKVIFLQEDGTMLDVYGNVIPENKRGYFTPQQLEEAVDSVGDNLIYYNNYGACTWDVVKGAIRHAVLVEGVEDVILDPISRMVQGLSASDTNQILEVFSDEISKMAKDLGFTYYCFCHLKAPEHGKPHERGGKVLSFQFTGSRAMMRSCYYMLGIERNKDPELSQKEQNTSTFVLLEDRKYGRSGQFPVFYDIDTGDYAEPPEGFLESDFQTLASWEERKQHKDF